MIIYILKGGTLFSFNNSYRHLSASLYARHSTEGCSVPVQPYKGGPHFTDGVHEGQGGLGTYPRSHSWEIEELGFEPKFWLHSVKSLLVYMPKQPASKPQKKWFLCVCEDK